jgi:hypothetical protein
MMKFILSIYLAAAIYCIVSSVGFYYYHDKKLTYLRELRDNSIIVFGIVSLLLATFGILFWGAGKINLADVLK